MQYVTSPQIAWKSQIRLDVPVRDTTPSGFFTRSRTMRIEEIVSGFDCTCIVSYRRAWCVYVYGLNCQTRVGG